VKRLADLNPRFLGSGGEGVYRRTDRLCKVCNGENAGECDACYGGGFEYEPAPERVGVGVMLTCPCGTCDEHHDLYVPFANPLDGGPALEHGKNNGWQRTGDTFETLTLTPSILRTRPHGCGWHGFITNGVVTGQVE
jgi:hypothetical protein